MAKSSKKDTKGSKEAPEEKSLMQFLVHDMESVLHQSLTDPSNHIPHVDMFSSNDNIYIDMNIPGIEEKELEVVFFKNTIKVTALKYECFDQKDLNYICMERSFGKIQRVIEIPYPVNTTKIEANYNHGILTITLPRVEEKRGRPINIQVKHLSSTKTKNTKDTKNKKTKPNKDK